MNQTLFRPCWRRRLNESLSSHRSTVPHFPSVSCMYPPPPPPVTLRRNQVRLYSRTVPTSRMNLHTNKNFNSFWNSKEGYESVMILAMLTSVTLLTTTTTTSPPSPSPSSWSSVTTTWSSPFHNETERVDNISPDELKNDWDQFMMNSMDPNENDLDESFQSENESNHTDRNDVKDDNNSLPTTTSSQNESEPMIDPYDNLPEHDEDTSCTMCLLNRQGPCRTYWRKFEHCMKDHVETKDTSSNASSHSPTSMGEQFCDKYMIPWLTCVQSFPNTYTRLMNQMYQQQFIDPVEQDIPSTSKILFDERKVEPESFLDLFEWYEFQSNAHWNMDDPKKIERDPKKERKEQESHQQTLETNTVETERKEETRIESSSDVFLIPASAKVNFMDPSTHGEIAIAYIRDQNGQILGFDQFTQWKKARKEQKTQSLNSQSRKEDPQFPLVVNCTFHMDPQTTKSIQVFALYRAEDTDTDTDTNINADTSSDSSSTTKSTKNSTGHAKDYDFRSSTTLYYSSFISLEDMFHRFSKALHSDEVDAKDESY